jgi:outer membrane lipoprotein carrier protein
MVHLGDNAVMRKLCLIICLLPIAAGAGGIEQLHRFLGSTTTATGAFEQVVLSASGKKPKKSSGLFAMQRPGKFRWTYEKPYRQLLVSDGVKMWSFDPEMNQVAVSKLGAAFGGSPAALLAGRDLEQNFELLDLPPNTAPNGIDFVEAKPKSADASFERMSLGFANGVPVKMEVHDKFGQITQIAFSRFDVNQSLPATTFQFVPPKGADVVGD